MYLLVTSHDFIDNTCTMNPFTNTADLDPLPKQCKILIKSTYFTTATHGNLSQKLEYTYNTFFFRRDLILITPTVKCKACRDKCC